MTGETASARGGVDRRRRGVRARRRPTRASGDRVGAGPGPTTLGICWPYWAARYGRAIPQPIKRGIADAVARLYTERAAVTYDATSRSWRMGDVLELTHARPWWAALSSSTRVASTGTGGRFSDAAFAVLPLMERGQAADWPF